jgi:uncharacterized C2H2 Zn-finger protein
MTFSCAKCGAVFQKNQGLQRHSARKKPCDPIVTQQSPGDSRSCQYCGRSYSRQDNLARHLKKSCKIANSAEGINKLFEHTLQQQLAAKIDRLTQLVEQFAVTSGGGAAGGTPAECAPGIGVANITTVNNVNTINATINYNAWDGGQRIRLGVAQIAAAFSENVKLREYAKLGSRELADPDIAPPYVTELFMDLTKRAHADPAARNAYLNPRRADQVLVHKLNGAWEVVPLAEATRLLFDGVAQSILVATRAQEERHQLPQEAQNALAMAGLLYDDEPDEYARRAKAPMAAHLENVAMVSASAAAG